jgi:NADH:ubiquinone oxidoreductase subunit 3 (subunit A)
MTIVIVAAIIRLVLYAIPLAIAVRQRNWLVLIATMLIIIPTVVFGFVSAPWRDSVI